MTAFIYKLQLQIFPEEKQHRCRVCYKDVQSSISCKTKLHHLIDVHKDLVHYSIWNASFLK